MPPTRSRRTSSRTAPALWDRYMATGVRFEPAGDGVIMAGRQIEVSMAGRPDAFTRVYRDKIQRVEVANRVSNFPAP